MQILIFEDEGIERFKPLLYLKPIYELRCGTKTLAEKFESSISHKLTFHCRNNLHAVHQEFHPERTLNTLLDTDVLFINGRVLCDDAFAKKIQSNSLQAGNAYFNGGQLVAFRGSPKEIFGDSLPDIVEAKFISQLLPVEQIDCTMISFMWDIIRLHPTEFIKDVKQENRLGTILGEVHPRATLVNESRIFIDQDAQIKAGAVLDAEDGYIIISKKGRVLPNSVLMNNVYLGREAVVKIGAKIYNNVYIGEKSKVGGEVEDSILESYTNKQHDGFLGHSYISSWCNLGAGTNNSDLKNNYSTIRMAVDGKQIDTKMQFIGLIMGEHSKTGINTMFNTGSVVGMSSNIFGAGFPPKSIDSFQWGSNQDGFTKYNLEKSLETVEAVFKRRNLLCSDEYKTLFRRCYHESSSFK